MKKIKGRIRKSKKTKDLLNRLNRGDIVLISHENMDEAICEGLEDKKIRCVLNLKKVATGDYPTPGPLKLIEGGIRIWEEVDYSVWENLEDGDRVSVIGPWIIEGNQILGTGKEVTSEEIKQRNKRGEKKLPNRLEEFLENTLQRARVEKDIVLKIDPPELDTKIKDRIALVVIRGRGYLKDLRCLLPFVLQEKPVVIAVDGGADGCMELGIVPDLIVGDMDSASDKALKCGAELLVHAYPDGRAPGGERLRKLGLKYTAFAVPGISEDAAMVLAHSQGAALIVAIGTHTDLIGFLDKGRQGMASTLLVRLKMGGQIVDAKGVARLYQDKFNFQKAGLLFLAALFPFFTAFYLSPLLRTVMNLFNLRLRLTLGF